MGADLPAAFLDISTKSSGRTEGAAEIYPFWLFLVSQLTHQSLE